MISGGIPILHLKGDVPSFLASAVGLWDFRAYS